MEQLWRLLPLRCTEEMAVEGCAEAILTFCLKMHQFYLPQRQMGFTVDRFQADCKLPVNARCVVWRAPLIVQPLYSSYMVVFNLFHSFVFSSYIINISGNEITLLPFFTGKDQKVIKIYVSDLSHLGTSIQG